METSILSFSFDQSISIRTIIIDNDPWFVAKDVAAALGYADTKSAISAHCKRSKSLKELGVANRRPSQNQALTLDPQTKLIPEPDVYRLISRSQLPSAERFEAWVFEEVLPSIRKSGGYQQQPPLPTDLPTALRLYADKLEQNAKQQLVIQQQAQEINASRPKVEFHDQVVMADKTYTFTEVFGLLKHYTGQNFNGSSFLQFLREQGIACKPNPHKGIGQRAFAPRQHYIGSWFVSQLTPAGDVEWLMRPLAVSALIELIMNAPEFEEVNKQLTAPTSH